METIVSQSAQTFSFAKVFLRIILIVGLTVILTLLAHPPFCAL